MALQTRETCYNKSAPAMLETSRGVATPSDRRCKDLFYSTQHNLDGDASSEVSMSTEYERLENARRLIKESHISTERPKTAGWKTRILARQHGCCHLCDRYTAHIMELHHVRPLDCFGETEEGNLVGLCPSCHAALHAIKWTRNDEKIRQLGRYFAENHTRVQADEFYRLADYLYPSYWISRGLM